MKQKDQLWWMCFVSSNIKDTKSKQCYRFFFIVLLRVKHVDMKWPNQQEAKADKYIGGYNLGV